MHVISRVLLKGCHSSTMSFEGSKGKSMRFWCIYMCEVTKNVYNICAQPRIFEANV